jgi:hypothetical protein
VSSDDNRTTAPASKGSSARAGPTLAITDEQNKPIKGVEVLVVRRDGTHLKMIASNELGLLEFQEEVSEPIVLFCAHPNFRHYYQAKGDFRGSSTIQMKAATKGGSLIIPDGTGYIPGLEGRLNPILDALGRTYVYAENIAIEGGKPQPVPFTINRPFQVRDSHGHVFHLEVVSIIGSSSLLEYERMPSQARQAGEGPGNQSTLSSKSASLAKPPRAKQNPQPGPNEIFVKPLTSLTDGQRFVLKQKLGAYRGSTVRIVLIGRDPQRNIVFEQLMDVFKDSGWKIQSSEIGMVAAVGVNLPPFPYLTSSDIAAPTVGGVFSIFANTGINLPLTPNAFMGPVIGEQPNIVIVIH